VPLVERPTGAGGQARGQEWLSWLCRWWSG